MIPEHIEATAQLLRAAAGHREYEQTGELIVQLCSTSADFVKALPTQDPQAREIVIFVSELLDWTDAMLRTARAAHADELRSVPFLRVYSRQEELSNL